MAIDVKKIVEAISKKIQENPDLINDLLSDPVKTVEKYTGIDLPDDKINAVIDGVKKKVGNLDIGDIASLASGLLGATKTTASKKTTKKENSIDAQDLIKGAQVLGSLLNKKK